jgi:hypothetical protein
MTKIYVPVRRQQDEQKAETEQNPRVQPGEGSAEEEEDQSVDSVSGSGGVEEISLDVNDLRTGVSLFARVGNLLALDIGAEAFLGQLKQALEGVEAEATLKARLQKVYAILERTLSTIDRNAETLAASHKPVGETVGAIGQNVEPTVPPSEQAVGSTIEQTAPQVGEAVESAARETVDAATPPRDDHSRAQRVLRPIEKAARTYAAQVRRAVSTTREAVRARRKAKAARDLTDDIPSPDNPKRNDHEQ